VSAIRGEGQGTAETSEGKERDGVKVREPLARKSVATGTAWLESLGAVKCSGGASEGKERGGVKVREPIARKGVVAGTT
jgi:hypothetical protein